MAPLVKEKKKEGHSGLEEVITLTLRLISPSLKVNWTQIFFLIGYERVFDYKDVLDEKKVKLVALKLRKYASIWWANLVAKKS